MQRESLSDHLKRYPFTGMSSTADSFDHACAEAAHKAVGRTSFDRIRSAVRLRDEILMRGA